MVEASSPIVGASWAPATTSSCDVFLDLFYELRDEGVPVSIQEWMTLMEALKEGLHGSSLMRFYNLSRACLVKSEAYFDAFDRVFARVFHGVEGELSIEDEVLEWLRDPKNFTPLTDEQRAALEHLSTDELMQRFLETLAEQDERHDGGGRWVGTGGRSPYGHGGEHPTGIRVGGTGRNRSAMKVAEDRRFKDYRTDVTLDRAKQWKRGALKRLRHLTRQGPEDRAGDIDETIDDDLQAMAGEIDFVFRAEKPQQHAPAAVHGRRRHRWSPIYKPVSRLLTALLRGTRAARVQAPTTSTTASTSGWGRPPICT